MFTYEVIIDIKVKCWTENRMNTYKIARHVTFYLSSSCCLDDNLLHIMCFETFEDKWGISSEQIRALIIKKYGSDPSVPGGYDTYVEIKDVYLYIQRINTQPPADQTFNI